MKKEKKRKVTNACEIYHPYHEDHSHIEFFKALKLLMKTGHRTEMADDYL